MGSTDQHQSRALTTSACRRVVRSTGRYRRGVLAPARWRIPAGALPAPGTGQDIWSEALRRLHDRLGLPDWVSVGEKDRRLRLHLDEPMDVALLRDLVDKTATTGQDTVIEEAPAPAEYGWSGGRAHEIVVPLAATTPPTPAIVIERTPPVLIGRDAVVLPGQEVLFAQLFGHPDHVDAILVNQVDRLLAELRGAGEEPRWWYIRYREPQPHLRLRLHPHRDSY
ncbi:MAG: thiopeptide-type bacteriocin biosynthesis protein, partial [Mycobacterium sp.]|nr:thiopeptide-type bacteriocin biosynthesis protein [Mycobacterium sp.]